MSQTYSTINRDMAGGRVYSTQHRGTATPPSRARVAPVQAAPPLARARVAPVQAAPPHTRFRFQLGTADLPMVAQAFPGITGRVTLEGRPGEVYRVDAELEGLPPGPDPAIGPVLWLVHDLTVPAGLAPEDLALLPRGSAGTGNQPGAVFTMDGNPATYGPAANTLSITVSPGRFAPVGPNAWRLQSDLSPERNQAFHPLFFGGPAALADINASVPSGSLARLMTDLFMRPATVHPELPLGSRYLDRLKAVAARHLVGAPVSMLDGAAFTRAAVTLEGLLRTIPVLMPTRERCVLQCGNRIEG